MLDGFCATGTVSDVFECAWIPSLWILAGHLTSSDALDDDDVLAASGNMCGASLHMASAGVDGCTSVIYAGEPSCVLSEWRPVWYDAVPVGGQL